MTYNLNPYVGVERVPILEPEIEREIKLRRFEKTQKSKLKYKLSSATLTGIICANLLKLVKLILNICMVIPRSAQ